MLKTHVHTAACAAVVSLAPMAMAGIHEDSAGVQGQDHTELEIIEINVSDGATDLMIGMTTSRFEDSTRYPVFFDSKAGGISENSNHWFRNVDMGANAVDAFAGIWADDGGGSQTFTNEGSDWNETGGGSVSGITGNTVSLLFSMDALGMGVRDVLKFNLGTSGGTNGDPAKDLVSTGSKAADWDGEAVSEDLGSYTAVPAPGSLALLGLAGGFAIRRRRV